MQGAERDRCYACELAPTARRLVYVFWAARGPPTKASFVQYAASPLGCFFACFGPPPSSSSHTLGSEGPILPFRSLLCRERAAYTYRYSPCQVDALGRHGGLSWMRPNIVAIRPPARPPARPDICFSTLHSGVIGHNSPPPSRTAAFAVLAWTA